MGNQESKEGLTHLEGGKDLPDYLNEKVSNMPNKIYEAPADCTVIWVS